MVLNDNVDKNNGGCHEYLMIFKEEMFVSRNFSMLLSGLVLLMLVKR